MLAGSCYALRPISFRKFHSQAFHAQGLHNCGRGRFSLHYQLPGSRVVPWSLKPWVERERERERERLPTDRGSLNNLTASAYYDKNDRDPAIELEGFPSELPSLSAAQLVCIPHSTMALPLEGRAESGEVEAWLWGQIQAEARRDAESEPALASYLYSTILSHSSLERSLSFHLGNKLCSSTLLSTLLYDLFLNAFSSDASLRAAVVADLRAARVRDPACVSFSHCLLNYKGFLACQAHRVAHKLWNQQRRPLALALHSRISDVFSVDIHPAARIGKGILFDHATGVVIGETAVIGNNCSILHHVTLGGTGKVGGDRHPKVGDGVLIGAGATILGNVKIGDGAKIGAGSVVLIDVPPRTTAVGNPARLVGGKEKPAKNEDVPGESMDHTSFISEWSDYII
ncbi:hypothetical protein Cgig2_012673 [Carnegiea gigantea]|uniref:serine O-acetyltransferase n=1 Tax=Carnegiea gigantea TaxID=171969 RepID=A0A9Q1GSM5_9CARY|nr:hypothetical protein Cgig2_012673 [Carnegiea gigantea]